MAANGYPETYIKGEKITIPDKSLDSKIFHAGTKLDKENIYSNGGRVLCATALGTDIKDAQTKAYKLIEKVKWEGAYYRTDIGFKAL
jgi:phosphoribosylamine--glycine ligase